MSDDDAADGRRDDRADLAIAKVRGELTTYPGGALRVLQDERALQVARAVHPRRQLEVAFQQRAGLLEHRQGLLLGFFDINWCRFHDWSLAVA